MLHDVPWCSMMFHDVPWCSMMLHVCANSLSLFVDYPCFHGVCRKCGTCSLAYMHVICRAKWGQHAPRSTSGHDHSGPLKSATASSPEMLHFPLSPNPVMFQSFSKNQFSQQSVCFHLQANLSCSSCNLFSDYWLVPYTALPSVWQSPVLKCSGAIWNVGLSSCCETISSWQDPDQEGQWINNPTVCTSHLPPITRRPHVKCPTNGVKSYSQTEVGTSARSTVCRKHHFLQLTLGYQLPRGASNSSLHKEQSCRSLGVPERNIKKLEFWILPCSKHI